MRARSERAYWNKQNRIYLEIQPARNIRFCVWWRKHTHTHTCARIRLTIRSPGCFIRFQNSFSAWIFISWPQIEFLRLNHLSMLTSYFVYIFIRRAGVCAAPLTHGSRRDNLYIFNVDWDVLYTRWAASMRFVNAKEFECINHFSRARTQRKPVLMIKVRPDFIEVFGVICALYGD